MSDTRWCIECKKPLNSGSNMSFLDLGSSPTFCKNTDCVRYGLVTAIYLEEEKKAPDNVKSNNPLEKEK